MEGGERVIVASSLFSLIIRGLKCHLSVILYFPYAVSVTKKSFKPALSQRRIKKKKKKTSGETYMQCLLFK